MIRNSVPPSGKGDCWIHGNIGVVWPCGVRVRSVFPPISHAKYPRMLACYQLLMNADDCTAN
jgi:hypothetical protein